MNHRNYYPRNNFVSGFLPPHLRAPVYSHQYVVPPASTTSLLTHHEICPLCIRYPCLPYHQYQPYVYYNPGMTATNSNMFRVLPPPTVMPPPLYSSLQIPVGFPSARPLWMGNPPPEHGAPTAERVASQNAQACRQAASQQQHQQQQPRNGNQDQTQLNQGSSRSGNYRQSKKPLHQSKANSSKHSRHQLSITSKSRSRLRYTTSFRKSVVRKPRRRSVANGENIKKNVSAVEPADLSSIPCVDEEQDDAYETVDEMEDVASNLDKRNACDTSESDWLNDTRLVTEAPALTNRHPHAAQQTPGDEADNSTLDFTIIRNDQSFSHINFNPDMLPNMYNRFHIPNAPTKLQQQQREPHLNKESDAPRPSSASRCDRTPSSKPSSNIPVFRDGSSKNATQSCRSVSISDIPTTAGNKIDNKVTTRSVDLKIAKLHTQDWYQSKRGPNGSNNTNNDVHGGTLLKVSSESNSTAPLSRRLSAFSNISKSSESASEKSALRHSSGDLNNNQSRERSKELWWDDSTDLGFSRELRGSEPAQSNSSCEQASQSFHLDETSDVRKTKLAFVQEVDDFVVVDTALGDSLLTRENSRGQQEKRDTFSLSGAAEFREPDGDENNRPDIPWRYSKWNADKSAADFRDFGSDTQINIVQNKSMSLDDKSTCTSSSQSDDGQIEASKDLSVTNKKNVESFSVSEQDGAIVAVIEKSVSESLFVAETSFSDLHDDLLNPNASDQNSGGGETAHVSVTRVEARRVFAPASSKRVANNWGKQDIRLYFLPTTAPNVPAVAQDCYRTTAGASFSSVIYANTKLSTKSHDPTLKTSKKQKAMSTSIAQHALPAVAIGKTLQNRRKSKVPKPVQSMPNSPAERPVSDQLRGRLTGSLDCIPSIIGSSNAWQSDLSETTGRELQIDCTRFNVQHRTVIDCSSGCSRNDRLPSAVAVQEQTYLLKATPAKSSTAAFEGNQLPAVQQSSQAACYESPMQPRTFMVRNKQRTRNERKASAGSSGAMRQVSTKSIKHATPYHSHTRRAKQATGSIMSAIGSATTAESHTCVTLRSSTGRNKPKLSVPAVANSSRASPVGKSAASSVTSSPCSSEVVTSATSPEILKNDRMRSKKVTKVQKESDVFASRRSAPRKNSINKTKPANPISRQRTGVRATAPVKSKGQISTATENILAVKSTLGLQESSQHITKHDGVFPNLANASVKQKATVKLGATTLTTNTVSKNVVSARPPNRRSPRTVRSSFSVVSTSTLIDKNDPVEENGEKRIPDKSGSNRRSKTVCSLKGYCASGVAQLDSTVAKSDGSNTSKCTTANAANPPENLCEGSIVRTVLHTAAETVSDAPEPACPPVVSTVVFAENATTRGPVHSTIRSIVCNLINQPLSHHNKALCSPSLVALRQRSSRAQGNQVHHAAMFFRHASCMEESGESHTSSMPTSPVNRSSLLSSRRSASLSDVFYDTSTEQSSSKMSLENCSCDPIGADAPFKSWRRLDLLKQTPAFLRLKKECAPSTYIGFSPPTMTPACVCSSRTKVLNKLVNKDDDSSSLTSSTPLEQNDKAAAPTDARKSQSDRTTNIITSNHSDSGERLSRVLSDDLEAEIREKVEDLLNSVQENSRCFNDTKKDDQMENFEAVKQAAPINYDSVLNQEKIVAADSVEPERVGNTDGVGRDSLDQSTQTFNQITVPDSGVSDPRLHKLLAAPKKPPRGKSPSARQDTASYTKTATSTQALDEKSSANFVSQEAVHSSGAAASPLIPYYPLMTAFPRLSPHRGAQLLSPALVPVKIGDHLYRAPSFSAFVWPGMPGQLGPAFLNLSDLSHSQSTEETCTSDKTFDDNKASDKTQRTANVTSSASQDDLLLIENPVTADIQDRVQDVPQLLVMSSSVIGPCYIPPRTTANHAKFLVAKKPKPVLRRRRSFPGLALSSAAVAKARLHRRYGYPGKNYQAAKPFRAAPSNLHNFSHPAPRPPTRRARFIRSSLSEDAVFQAVDQKPRAPVFMTKPVKVTGQNEGRHEANSIDKCREPITSTAKDNGENQANADAGSGAETGYSSTPASSGRTTPEDLRAKQDSECLSTLEVIPESYHDQQTNLASDAQDDSELTDAKRRQKGKKAHHGFHAIVKLKRFMSAKKAACGVPEDSVSTSDLNLTTIPVASTSLSPKTSLKKSKTESKLGDREDQLHNSKEVRDMFRRNKKMQAEKSDKVPKDQQQESFMTKLGRRTSREFQALGKRTSRELQAPGFRPNYDIKAALLKPSFVALAPSEVRTDIDHYESTEDAGTEATYSDRDSQQESELTDSLSTSIRCDSTRKSVSTPGVRINSETGDVIDEEKTVRGESVSDADPQNPRYQKILCSTAIDDSLDDTTKTLQLRDGGSIGPRDDSSAKPSNSVASSVVKQHSAHTDLGILVEGKESPEI